MVDGVWFKVSAKRLPDGDLLFLGYSKSGANRIFIQEGRANEELFQSIKNHGFDWRPHTSET